MSDTKSSLSFSTWRKIAMATWRPRNGSMIWATADIEAPRLLEYIDRIRRATGQHVTPAHLGGRAAGKVFEAQPGLNGRVAFGGFLPSPTIDCFFVISLRTDPVTGAEAVGTDLAGADKVLALDGQCVIRRVLPLTIGLDHRFIDGYHAATMARVFRESLANPAAFDPVPIHIARQQNTGPSVVARTRPASNRFAQLGARSTGRGQSDDH